MKKIVLKFFCFSLLALSLINGQVVAQEQTKEQGNSFYFIPQAVFYSGDTMRSFMLPGVTINYRFADNWEIGSSVYFAKAKLDQTAATVYNDKQRFYLADIAISYLTPIRIGAESDPWRADIYASLGFSYLSLGNNGYGGFVGGGMNIYTKYSWLSLHFDLKNIFYSLSNNAGSDFNSDMTFAFGPSLSF